MKPNMLRQFFMGLGMISLVMLTGCDRGAEDAVWWNGEHERIDLSHRLELKRFQLQQIEPVTGLAEATRMIKAAAALGFRVDELRRTKAELSGELDGLASNLETTRRVVLIEQRRRATGLAFEEFRIPSGRVFASATVAGIDDSGVTLRHADGSATLRFKDLSAAQRELFGLEQASALAAEKRETSDTLAYERWIDGQLAVSRVKQKQEAEKQEIAKEREAKILAAATARVSETSRPIEEFSSANRVRYRTDRSSRSSFTSYYYVRPSIRYYAPASGGTRYPRPMISIYPQRVSPYGCYTP